MADLTIVICQRCQKQAQDGEVVFSFRGSRVYIDSIPGSWYWSEDDRCWYCSPCERQLVKEILGEVFDLCKEKGTKIVDFQGQEIDSPDQIL